MFLPSVSHSDQYYLALLTALISAVKAGFTDRQIADYLNSRAILSPSGKPFTSNSVSQILKKLRNHKEYPSRLHKALLQLVFDGKLTAPETYILFQPRRQGM